MQQAEKFNGAEGKKPTPDNRVRLLFYTRAFMPLPISLERSPVTVPFLLSKGKHDYCTFALMYDPGLAAAAFNSGERATHFGAFYIR